MFKIIKFHKEHLTAIEQIAKENNKFNLPDISSPLILLRISIVDEEGVIVAAGFLKLIGEAILTIDKNLTISKKAEIVSMFHKVGTRAAKKKGLDEINAFITEDKSFVNFLLKRLDFVESGAEVLVKRL